MSKTKVTRVPFDEQGNLMHWAREGDGWGAAHEWRPNVPFVADLLAAISRPYFGAGLESSFRAVYEKKLRETGAIE